MYFSKRIVVIGGAIVLGLAGSALSTEMLAAKGHSMLAQANLEAPQSKKSAETSKKNEKKKTKRVSAALARTIIDVCTSNAEQQVELNEVFSDQAQNCSGYQDAECYNEHSSRIRKIQAKYQLRLQPLLELAKKQGKSEITNEDCCESVPGRYKRLQDGTCFLYR